MGCHLRTFIVLLWDVSQKFNIHIWRTNIGKNDPGMHYIKHPLNWHPAGATNVTLSRFLVCSTKYNKCIDT